MADLAKMHFFNIKNGKYKECTHKTNIPDNCVKEAILGHLGSRLRHLHKGVTPELIAEYSKCQIENNDFYCTTRGF